MRTFRNLTIVLAIALVGTNAWWAYNSIDRGISLAYLQLSYATESELLKQSLSVLNASASSSVTRDQILQAAQLNDPTNAPFEKEGYVWVGQLGLKFGSDGKLV